MHTYTRIVVANTINNACINILDTPIYVLAYYHHFVISLNKQYTAFKPSFKLNKSEKKRTKKNGKLQTLSKDKQNGITTVSTATTIITITK